MTTEAILNLLKIAGFVLAAISTIWALTQKTTVEDEKGRKRLTRSGRVSVGLAAGFLAIALASLYFENRARAAQAASAAELKAAAESQFGRILNPITDHRVRVVWEVPIAGQISALADLAGRAGADPRLITSMPGFLDAEADAQERIFRFGFNDESPLYQTVLQDSEVHLAAIGATADVAFFKDRSEVTSFLAAVGEQDFREIGDLRFRIVHRYPRSLKYDARKDALEMEMEIPSNAVVRRNGKIPSVPDLEKSTMLLSLNAVPVLGLEHDSRQLSEIQSRMKPVRVTMEASGRSYRNEHIVEHRQKGRSPIFVVVLGPDPQS